MSDSDESINFKSEDFDPLKALYSSRIKLPCPSAPMYDNMSKYTSVVLKGGTTQVKKKTESQPSTSQPVRRFLPHQMPVSCPRPERTLRNVLTRMQSHVGPLEVLRTCMDERLRVKVYTRNMKTVRGYVEAFVAAFDKHWNMALEDVCEVWVRKRRPKVPALGPGTPGLLAQKRLGATPPPVMVVPIGGGVDRCERHVAQLLVRGEQVVLVAVADLDSREIAAAKDKKKKEEEEDTEKRKKEEEDTEKRKKKEEDTEKRKTKEEKEEEEDKGEVT